MVVNVRTILIADPNPHVRRFLKREMAEEGYEVLLAHTFQELVRLIFQPGTIDLVIVDPDFPDIPVHALLKRLHNRVPPVPIIMHTHDAAVGNDLEEKSSLHIVEKRGNSIERLKQLASQLLPAAGNSTDPATNQQRN